ncbi:hypothetical protein D1867_10805 [Acidianus infernus]|uniref:DUF4352 domain-containing protein n=1 Tax=Acidianus infernus TaxID=12915 RepID=A0A6A9QK76_ACIIN|nr:hypothetical protein [Acidianus infernus]MUM65720.1 hypothetical protein [Acidianus infernus]
MKGTTNSKKYIVMVSVIIFLIVIISIIAIKPSSSKNCTITIIKQGCIKHGILPCMAKIGLNGSVYYFNLTVYNPGKSVPICCIRLDKVAITFNKIFVFYKNSYYGDEIPQGKNIIIIAFNTTCSNITSLTIHLENGQNLQLNFA